MKLNIVLELRGVEDPDGAREALAQFYAIDYTHVLECALRHWEMLSQPASEVNDAQLERTLRRLLNRRIEGMDFEEFAYSLELLRTAAERMHAALLPLLQPILGSVHERYRPVLELKRYHTRATPVIELRLTERST